MLLQLIASSFILLSSHMTTIKVDKTLDSTSYISELSLEEDKQVSTIFCLGNFVITTQEYNSVVIPGSVLYGHELPLNVQFPSRCRHEHYCFRFDPFRGLTRVLQRVSYTTGSC